jgi:hypothetical protein
VASGRSWRGSARPRPFLLEVRDDRTLQGDTDAAGRRGSTTAETHEITLPADYDMQIIRDRVGATGHLLDSYPGLGVKRS